MTARPLAAALLLLLLCAAALVPTGPAAAQSSGRSDPAVTGLFFAGPVPGWTDGEANSTEVRAVVSNLGSAPSGYELDYYWLDEAGFSMPLKGFDEDTGVAYSSTDVSRTPLGPGEQRIHKIQWTPVQGQQGNGTVMAIVSVANLTEAGEQGPDADDSNNARLLPVFIAVRDVFVSVVDRPSVAEPGAPGFFRLAVHNDGNLPAPVSFTVIDPPKDVRLTPSFYPSPLLVPPRSQRNATLYVDYDPAGDFTPFKVAYTVEADPGYLPRQRVTTPWLTNGSEEPSLDGFALSLARQQDSRLALARGAWAETPFTLTNNGSRPDSYTLAAAADLAAWSTEVVPAKAALYPGESATVLLRVRAPLSAPVGSSTLVNVTALPSLLPNATLVTVPAFVPGAQLSIGTFSLEDPIPYVRDTPVVLATVVNDGAQAAGSGAVLRVAWNAPGSPTKFRDELLPAIAVGETLPRAIELPGLEAGGLLTVEATVRSVEGVLSTAARTSAFVHEAILALPDPEALQGSPGETVTYEIAPSAFRLHNLGNAAETVVVEASSDGGSAVVAGGTFTFRPGEQRTVLVRQTLPTGAPNGTVANLTVTARLEHRDDFVWTATASTRLVDDERPLLRFDPPLPAEWDLGTPLAIRLLAEDAGGLSNVSLTASDAGGNRTVLPLDPAGNGTWLAHLTLPAVGNHTFRAHAQDLSGNAANASQAVRAERVPPPRLRVDGPEPAAALNATDRLRVLIVDERAIARATLEIRQGADTTRRNLTVDNGAVEFDLQGAREGPAELVVEATNAAGASSSLTLHVEVAAPAPQAAELPDGRDAPWPAALALAGLALAAALRRRDRGPGGAP